jgi:membrane peptidoglycan carboxypeptidase
VPPAVATTLNQILIGDTASPIGTGTRAAIPGHDIAGKTGTSQDRFSVAFVGYTPQYAASVMVLNPKRNQDVGAYGGRGAAPIWHDAMLPILSAQPAVPFPPAGIELAPPPPPPRPAVDRSDEGVPDEDVPVEDVPDEEAQDEQPPPEEAPAEEAPTEEAPAEPPVDEPTG